MTKLLILSDSHGSTRRSAASWRPKKTPAPSFFWGTASTIWSWP